MPNKMVFSEQECANSFILWLTNYNKNNNDNDQYNDIHIYQEDEFIVVEWVQIPYNHEYGGKFEFVDENQSIVTEFTYPDGEYGYAFDKEDKNKLIEDWYNKNSDKV